MVMDHAKKLVLVEPRLLEQLQLNNEYKELQKRPDIKSQSVASMELRNMINQNELSDDLKAKLYQQALSRFMNLTDEISPLTKDIVNPITRPVPPAPQVLPLSTPQKQTTTVKRKKQVPRRFAPYIQNPSRSKRTKSASKWPLWLEY